MQAPNFLKPRTAPAPPKRKDNGISSAENINRTAHVLFTDRKEEQSDSQSVSERLDS